MHHLGETFVGLNAFGDKRQDTLSFERMAEPRFRGMKVVARGTAELVRYDARMFVGLNSNTQPNQ